MGKKLTVEEAIAKIRSLCIVTARGCWEYQGSGNDLGYGQVTFHGRKWMVHRFMRWHIKGPFDLSLDLCHECDNPPCCNPDHTWIGDPKANAADCVEKGRHYKAARTHCPKGHPYADTAVTYGTKTNWRYCKVCELAKVRIKAGWPQDLAYSLPPQKLGWRPPGLERKPPKPKSQGRRRTHCKRGHPFEGENIYKKPNGGRQCKICHDAAVSAWMARGKVLLSPIT